MSLARCARPVSRTRLMILFIAAMVVAAMVVPLPTAMQLRNWAISLGPWFALAFFTAHVIVTTVPIPRTTFTVAAGLLFGPALGIGIAITASTISALIALHIFRVCRYRGNTIIHQQRFAALHDHIRVRGWRAVMWLRLVPAIPFSVINYAAAASTVPITGYLIATFLGLIPGTTAVILLANAVTAAPSSLLVLTLVCTASIGITGLLYEIRCFRTTHITPHQPGEVNHPAVAQP